MKPLNTLAALKHFTIPFSVPAAIAIHPLVIGQMKRIPLKADRLGWGRESQTNDDLEISHTSGIENQYHASRTLNVILKLCGTVVVQIVVDSDIGRFRFGVCQQFVFFSYLFPLHTFGTHPMSITVWRLLGDGVLFSNESIREE